MCNMEEPELIQLSGFGSVVLGSSCSCLRSNLMECPREVCVPFPVGGKSCVMGMAHKIRHIRGKKGNAEGFSCSPNLCIF